MTLPPLYILRHGQTEWNVAGRLQGHGDSPLTEQGRADARAQGAVLRSVADAHPLTCYASPQGRVRQTHAIALADLDLPVQEDPRLMEAGAGRWQGLTEAEIEARWPEVFAQYPTRVALSFGAPGGETFEDVETRCRSFLADLRGPSVIFTHGVTLAVLRAAACGLDYEAMIALDHRQGVVYVVKDGAEHVLTPPV